MNILFISHGLYPCKIGGVEIFNYFLIDALAQNNNNIYVITDCHEVKFSSANVRIVKMSPKRYFSTKLSTIINDSVNIVKLRKSIDVIHTPYMGNSWILGCYLPLIKRIFGVPYVVSIHGGGMHEWGPKFVREALFKNASAIAAGTESFKNVYERRLKRQINLIPPLIPCFESQVDKNSLRKKYGYNEENTIILCVGSIKKIKGNDTLLDAFISLGEKFITCHNLKLCFVGDGPLLKELKKKVKKCNFQNYIKFHGQVKYENVFEVFKMSDIYIIASWYEGISKTLLEAMFNGLLVIGSDTVGIRDNIKNGFNGFLFQPKDSKSLMEKLKFLIENRNTRQMNQIRKNARDYYNSKFSFSKAVNMFETVYRKVNDMKVQ